MSEKRRGEPRVEVKKAEYDTEEVARFLAKAVERHGGEYVEKLKVDSAGQIILDSRNGDELTAFLPMALERPDGNDPTIEDVYQALRNIGDVLPGYEISINEDRTAGSFQYRTKRKAAGAQS